MWSVALRRSGVMIWLAFPFIFFCAFQIVLLYLFGNSIIATDMFTNLLTTNPGEAGELLGKLAHVAGLAPDEGSVTARELIPQFSWASVPREDILCEM